MRNLNKVLSVALSLAMAASLVACGNTTADDTGSTTTQESTTQENAKSDTSEEPVTITFALWDEIQSVVYQELIDKFEEQNPDIKVEMQLTPWDQYWTKFEATAGSNQAPDTYFMNATWQKYTDAGVMEPLNDYIEKDGVDMSVYTPALVDFFTTQDGVIGCMPKGMDSIAVACNKAMFEKYGVELPNGDWTWDDMLSVCASLKEKMDGAGDDAYPMALALNSINSSWGHIMFQFGGSLFEDGKCTFNTPENVNAFKGITDMIDKGYIPDYTVVSDTSAEDLYISGKAAMIYLPTFSSQKIEQSDMKDTVLVTLPKAESKDAMLIGMGYGMNANGEHKEQAWRFLKYLGSEEANEIIGKSGIDMPAMTSMQKYYPESFKSFDGNPFVDQLQYTKAYDMGPVSTVGESSQIYNDYVMQMLTGQIGVEEGLKEINTQVDALN